MVHNGIEYGDMQLICEAYNLLERGLGLTADELHEIFVDWNKGELDSYLIEISSQIFAKKDEDGSRWSIRSLIQPARKARASGLSSARSTWASR